MIHKNEIYPTFNIMPRNDVYECNEDLLNEALNGLQNCEGCKIDESLYVKVRMYKEMIQQAGYLFRDDGLQTPFLHGKYKELLIGQCKECKRKDSLLFKKDGCPVKNPRNKTEEEND